MAVIEKELKSMPQQQLQKKQPSIIRQELRKALLKQSVKDNYEALERLSRT